MGQIFKRRNRRPVMVKRGTKRKTPNFYPSFYDDGSYLKLPKISDELDPAAGPFANPKSPLAGGRKYRKGNGFDDYMSYFLDNFESSRENLDAAMDWWTNGGEDKWNNLDTLEHISLDTKGLSDLGKLATEGALADLNAHQFDDTGVVPPKKVPGPKKKKDTSGVASKVAAGLSGAASLYGDFTDLNSVADTSLLDARRDELENMDYSGIGSPSDSLSAWNSTGFIRNPVTYRQMRGKSDGELALGVGKSIAEGALTGLEVGGPWGALAGAVVGTGTGLAGLFSGNARARRKKREENDAIRLANAGATNTYAGATQNAFERAFNRGLGTLAAYGGRIYAGGGAEAEDTPESKQGLLSTVYGKLKSLVSPSKPEPEPEPEWEDVPAVYDKTTQRLRPMNEEEAGNYAEYGHPDGRWSRNEDYDEIMSKEFKRIFGFSNSGRQAEMCRIVYEVGMELGLTLPRISALMAMVMHELPDDYSDKKKDKNEVPLYEYEMDGKGNFIRDEKGKKIRLPWNGRMERTSGPFQFSETYYVDPNDTTKVTKDAPQDTSYKRYRNWLAENGRSGDFADSVLYYITKYIPYMFEEYARRSGKNFYGPYSDLNVNAETMWNDDSTDVGTLADIANFVFQRSSSKDDETYRAENIVRARALIDFYNALYTTHSKGDPYDLTVRVERGKAGGGPIHIDESNRGKFREEAERAGQGVQEHARSVMRDPNATPLQRRRANFAINAAKWRHGNADGGLLRVYK